MAKSSYEVVVIHKGREGDYFDFWVKKIKKNDAGEELHSALVGFVEIVEANNSKEAVLIVQKRHPNNQIDAEATTRFG